MERRIVEKVVWGDNVGEAATGSLPITCSSTRFLVDLALFNSGCKVQSVVENGFMKSCIAFFSVLL